MKKIIKRFIKRNREISKKLITNYPEYFSGNSYVTYFGDILTDCVDSSGERSILEIGGADRPFTIKGQRKTDGLDISDLNNPSEFYENYYCQSVEKPFPNNFDLIYSITLLEHVADNKSAIRNVYTSLAENGKMVHYIPNKFHPYSLILRMIGPRLQGILIDWLRPDASDVSGYPAFFNHCSPSQMTALCESIGFKNIKVYPFYRANDYFAFFVPAFILISIYENWCKHFQLKSASSGFILVAEKG